MYIVEESAKCRYILEALLALCVCVKCILLEAIMKAGERVCVYERERD